MHIDWDNTKVMGISGIKIDMPSDADNNLTHINDDHFEINLVARLLNQICVVPVPPPGHDYDNLHANVMDQLLAYQQVQLPLDLHFHSQHQCCHYHASTCQRYKIMK